MRAIDLCACGHERGAHYMAEEHCTWCDCSKWLPHPQPRTMPKQKPGKSVQDVGTPDWLIEVIEKTWGPIGLDAAASHENHVSSSYYTPEIDGLESPWSVPPGEVVFVNPPYGNIAPWVEKAARINQNWKHTVIVLVPASVGSNWWAEHVDGKAAVYFLRPRLTFKGHVNCYPKDVALLIYGEPPRYRCVKVTDDGSFSEDTNGQDPVS